MLAIQVEPLDAKVFDTEKQTPHISSWVSLSLHLAPYGAYFVCTAGPEDVTCYRFNESTAGCEFVIEERDWAQTDSDGWLQNASESLEDWAFSRS